MANPTDSRRHLRQLAVEHSALVEALAELYPTDRIPDINATDREIGAWIGQRALVRQLQLLIREAREGTSGSLPNVIGG